MKRFKRESQCLSGFGWLFSRKTRFCGVGIETRVRLASGVFVSGVQGSGVGGRQKAGVTDPGAPGRSELSQLLPPCARLPTTAAVGAAAAVLVLSTFSKIDPWGETVEFCLWVSLELIGRTRAGAL